MIRSLPIGVFDSGVGGLTVAAALNRRLPGESLIYLGDLARLPYGSKSPETVTRYALKAADFLTRLGIKLLVIACNTATAHALGAVQAAFPHLPVLGVIEAGARRAADLSPSGNIVVAATEGTCRSGAFIRSISAHRPQARIRQIPCPLFVPLAEEGLITGPMAETLAAHYLATAFPAQTAGGGNDCLVLGCTHFPILVPVLRQVLGQAPILVDCAEAVARQTQDTLAERGIESGAGRGSIQLIATDAPDRFARMADRFFPALGGASLVELADI